MKFTNNLAAIHGYLCGDGYVIRNPLTQSHKYYHIGFRNTNMVLLRDFQSKFFSEFGIKPIITNDGRCKIQNKKIYYILTKDFSYYSYEWELPKLSKINLDEKLAEFIGILLGDGHISSIKKGKKIVPKIMIRGA